MTENDAIEELKFNNEKCLEQCEGACFSRKNNDCACQDAVIERMLDELLQYREIGTVEELKKTVKEEDALKFYYCESEDNYYIGKRVGNFYYARYGETGFEWFMSRYLPWGEHVIAPNTVWKEYTYPSEPKEIPFFEWLQGFIKRYCGGTVKECREAVEKRRVKLLNNEPLKGGTGGRTMNDDLISRKAVIEAVDRHTREDGTLDDDISIILEEVKTAYDKKTDDNEQSNADCIRSMTDEELAKFILEFSACKICKYFDKRIGRCSADNSFLCVKKYAEAIIYDWLNKPVKDENERKSCLYSRR